MDTLLYRLFIVALIGFYSFIVVCLITGDGISKMVSWILDRPSSDIETEAFISGFAMGALTVLLWSWVWVVSR